MYCIVGVRSKSPFVKRPMAKRALFIRHQLCLVSVYKSVESDKKKYCIRFKRYH